MKTSLYILFYNSMIQISTESLHGVLHNNADHPPAPARSVAEGLARRLRKQTTCQRNGRVNLSCYVACMHINSSSSFSIYDYYINDYSLFISRAEAGNHSPQYISMWQPYPSRRQRPPKRNTYPAEEINFTPSSRNTSKISVIGTRNGMPRSMVVSDSSAFKKYGNDSVPAATTSKESPESSAPTRTATTITFALLAAKDSISVPGRAALMQSKADSSVRRASDTRSTSEPTASTIRLYRSESSPTIFPSRQNAFRRGISPHLHAHS